MNHNILGDYLLVLGRTHYEYSDYMNTNLKEFINIAINNYAFYINEPFPIPFNNDIREWLVQVSQNESALIFLFERTFKSSYIRYTNRKNVEQVFSTGKKLHIRMNQGPIHEPELMLIIHGPYLSFEKIGFHKHLAPSHSESSKLNTFRFTFDEVIFRDMPHYDIHVNAINYVKNELNDLMIVDEELASKLKLLSSYNVHEYIETDNIIVSFPSEKHRITQSPYFLHNYTTEGITENLDDLNFLTDVIIHGDNNGTFKQHITRSTIIEDIVRYSIHNPTHRLALCGFGNLRIHRRHETIGTIAEFKILNCREIAFHNS